jgi:hypothetical protein
MTNLDQIIDYTKLFQDVELATAVGQLKQNPSQLQQFLQEQQTKVYSDVIKQKDSTFQKVYGDLNRASVAQESILMLDRRNQELANMNNEILQNKTKTASSITEDKNLEGRKYEMNQWSVGNKKDTLFIFSFLFIALSALILITVLWRMGTISSTLCAGLFAPIIIIFVLVVINRTQYTNIFRDKRYWNRRDFGGKYGKIPIPLCPGALSGIESEVSSINVDIESNIANAGKGIASGTKTVAEDINIMINNTTQSIS